MPNPATERVLAALQVHGKAPRPDGDSWKAKCPAHEDDTASLNITEGQDGRALLHCHAGCPIEQIVAALGLEMKDLFSEDGRSRNGRPSPKKAQRRVTLVDLARDKGLPLDFLKNLGLHDLPGSRGVGIPYKDVQGKEVLVKRRIALAAREGSRWPKGKSLMPYGLERLGQAREAGRLLLVEGESDAWAAWLYDLPCLGLPGASATGCLEAAHLEGIGHLLVWREPDAGGGNFVQGIAERLHALGWQGRASILRPPEGIKDLLDLHRRHPNPEAFKLALKGLVEAAEPLPEPAAPARTDVEELDRLAALPVLEYEKVREAEAKALGVRVLILDGLVAQRRREIKAQAKGNGLDGELEPWPDPVDGAALLGAFRDTIRAHVVLPEHEAEATALWAVFAHTHDAFTTSPILAVESPQKRCGKTTLLTVLGLLCPRRLPAASITPAATFRVIEVARPTLMIDEGDTFLRDNEELRGVLNSGHFRYSAYVWRCVGEDAEPTRFSTWCPKAIALIGELPATLQDRSIVLRLRRKLPTERVKRFRADRTDALQELARQAARWAEDNLDALRRADPNVPVPLNDRAADNWRPLLAIADRVAPPWPELARRAALALSGLSEQEDEQTVAVQLLADCRQVFEQALADALTPSDLVNKLCELPESPWGECRHGKPITPRGVARLLKPFEIRSSGMTRRFGPLGRYYARVSFLDAWSRYLSPLDTPSASDTPATQRTSQEILPSASDTLVSDTQKEKGHGISNVSNVSDKNPPPGGKHMRSDASPPGNGGEGPPDDAEGAPALEVFEV